MYFNSQQKFSNITGNILIAKYFKKLFKQILITINKNNANFDLKFKNINHKIQMFYAINQNQKNI